MNPVPSSNTLISAINIYVTIVALVIVVKSIYDSASLESHLNDIEDQLELLHDSFVGSHQVIRPRWGRGRVYRAPHRIFRHKTRLHRMREKLHATKKQLRKVKRRKRSGYGYPSEDGLADEIEFEPQAPPNAAASAHQKGPKTKGAMYSTEVYPNSIPKKQPAVFVFPFGEANAAQDSFSFYARQSDANRPVVLR